MANVPETSEWTAGIYQLETTDPVLGGEGGIANRQAEELANRTLWLKDQLETTTELLAQHAAGVRPLTVMDGDGRPHQMVFVPRFRLPASSIGSWPSEPIEFGGFLVDQFAASNPNATPTARGVGDNPTVTAGPTRACSTPGVVPWTNITLANAKQACINRELYGTPCRLMGPEHWMAIQLLSLGNVNPRGNISQGRDSRDPNQWDSFGVPDPTRAGRCLVGTGPVSWAHNGIPSGIADWIGNVAMMLDMEVEAGRLIHWLAAAIDDADGISDTDTSLTISGVESSALWPTAGTIFIAAEGANDDEYCTYSGWADNGNGTFTLSGLVRGQLGTSASAHADAAVVRLRSDFCLVPGGVSAYLVADINDSDDPVTLQYDRRELGPGASGFAAGQLLNIDGEVLLIDSVVAIGSGGTLECTRAQMGTAAAAHDAGDLIFQRAPSGTLFTSSTVEHQAYIGSLRDEPMLRRLGLPATLSPTAVSPILDGCRFRLDHADGASTWVSRGGDYRGFVPLPQRGWACNHEYSTGGEPHVGFRAVLELENV